MTAKNGIPGGGLRIGIKAGGCSGLSYTFAWEAEPARGGPRLRRPRRRPHLRGPEEPPLPAARDTRVQVRLRHRRRSRDDPQGAQRGRRPADLEKKGEPEWLLEWRLKAYRLWLTMKEPTWQNVKYDADRLPGHRLLLGAEEEEDAEQPRRGRSGGEADVREARHPARGAEAAGRASRWTRCSTASRSRRRSRRSSPRWASSSARSPRRCASIPSW
jgi:hypothetical protein